MMLHATEMAGFAGAALAGIAYVPQISHLARQHCAAGISRFAFSVWLVASLLVMTRAIAIHATVFIALGAVQVLATAIICVYAKVYDGSYCENHLPLALIREPGQSQGPMDGVFESAEASGQRAERSAASEPMKGRHE